MKVAWVHYPDLEGDEYHDLAKKYMPNGTCGVLTFGIKGGRDASVTLMDHLKLAAIVTRSRCSYIRIASGKPYAPSDERAGITGSRRTA